MSIANALPKHLRPRREKVFGLARGFPHDRNARVRIEAYVLAWNAKHKQEGPAPGADYRRPSARLARALGAFHELRRRTRTDGNYATDMGNTRTIYCLCRPSFAFCRLLVCHRNVWRTSQRPINHMRFASENT
jgi:hypothetical protein